jgi:hypothetical protein
MLQEGTWYEYKRANIEMIPKGACGGYVIADENKVTLYIGSSESRNVGIRGRLISHFIKRKVRLGRYFKFRFSSMLKTGKDLEAETVKMHVEEHGKKPARLKRAPPVRRGFW